MKTLSLDKALSKLDNFLKIPFILAIFSYIIILAHKALFDLDIWLHLKTGEIIFQNKAIPGQDIFSFTIAGKRWVDHEWLFQVMVYLVNLRWHADGIIFLQTLIISMAFLVLFFIAYKSTGSYFISSLLLILSLNSAITRFNIRPEIFSLLLFSLYLYILFYQVRTIWLWLLLPLQILWVNLHGFFFLGVILVLFFCLGEIPIGKSRGDTFSPQQYRRLAIILFSLLAVSILPKDKIIKRIEINYLRIKPAVLEKTQAKSKSWNNLDKLSLNRPLSLSDKDKFSEDSLPFSGARAIEVPAMSSGIPRKPDRGRI